MLNKNQFVVNLFGGPGAGKSTTAAGVFSLLKLHGVDCEMITEFAKDLVWEERHNTLQNQRYVFSKQYHKMWRLKGKVDVILTDSPLMLSIIYKPKQYKEPFSYDVLDAVNEFDNINFILDRVKEYHQNGRIEDEEKANIIDDNIIHLLKKHNMPMTSVPGNYDGINKITCEILNKIGNKNIFSIVKRRGG